jgi:hypothetical protein
MAGSSWLDEQEPGPAESEGLVRDLEAYARGTAHAVPSELLPRVLAAVAREAPPTPPVGFARAVAALAPRDAARAFGGMLALIDGGRRGGPALRLRAAAMVVATILVVGSAAAGATFGGAQLVHGWLVTQAGPSTTATDVVSPTPARTSEAATPTPVEHSPHGSARPSDSEGPHETVEPTGPAESAEPTENDGDQPSGDPQDRPGPSSGGGSGGGGHSPEPSGGD